MRNMVSKAIVAGVAALALGAATLGAVEPAAADGPGWHGGGPGWHGGGPGWGGGWHGAGPGWRGPGPGAWHPGYWSGGSWNNGWWGPAVALGALTAGAIAIGAANSAPVYADPCVQVRPLYSANGRWIGNGPVNVCE